MTDRLAAIRVFQRTARLGSFSKAARELGLSQPSVSRIIAQLEQEIGANLLVRTTRAVTLTEVGQDYLSRVESILAALEEADLAARGNGELRGTLRIALTSSFGVREVIPRLPKFMAHHPALSIDLAICDAYPNLVAEGVDVALRLGALSDTAAVARKLGQSMRLVVAAPSYLARAGAPQKPTDLVGHAVIQGPDFVGDTLAFSSGDQHISVRVGGRVSVTTSEGATAAAAAGLGITVTPLWKCRRELASGALRQVLNDWALPPIDLYAVFPGSPAPAARAFADYIGSACDSLAASV